MRRLLLLLLALSFVPALFAQDDELPPDEVADLVDRYVERGIESLREGSYVEPLRVATGADGSVWDVLAHPNGRIYYTTFFEALGSVGRDGSDPRTHAELGPGLNELAVGPGGSLYATRYARDPRRPGAGASGSVVVATPEGELLRELALPGEPGLVRSPKSLAVDPATGQIHLNVDVFGPDGAVGYERIRLAPGGEVLEHRRSPPELHFPAFDAAGRGWFAESEEGRLRLRVTEGRRELVRRELGAREELDFVQDIRFRDDGAALLAFWSGRIVVARLLVEDGSPARPATQPARSSSPSAELDTCELRLALPEACRPPRGRGLVYTAVAGPEALHATLYCGATVLTAPWPAGCGPRSPASPSVAGRAFGPESRRDMNGAPPDSDPTR